MTNAEHLLRFERFQKSRERFFAPKINEALHKQYLQFTENVRRDGLEAVNAISPTNIMQVIRNLYMDAGIVYGKKIRADLNKVKKEIKELKAGQIGFSERVAQLIADYFRTDVFNTSMEITETTKDLIRKLFTDAYALGLSLDEIVKQLEDTELSKVRARLIARTETVTSSNQAGHFVAKESGLELNKVWLSARDSRVRRDHLQINGHKVGIDDYFIVGGEEMLNPGWRGGKDGKPVVSASNIVNCRCVCQYRTLE